MITVHEWEEDDTDEQNYNDHDEGEDDEKGGRREWDYYAVYNEHIDDEEDWGRWGEG